MLKKTFRLVRGTVTTTLTDALENRRERGMSLEEIELMAFKCLKCGDLFFIDDHGYFRKVKTWRRFQAVRDDTLSRL